MIHKTTLLSLLGTALLAAVGFTLSFATAAALPGPDDTLASPAFAPNEIHVIEHPGYFETRGNVFQIESGTYTFVVENRSGKDAGFVVAAEGAEPQAIGIADGKTGRLEIELEAGNHTYYCPIIPTAPYPILVK